MTETQLKYLCAMKNQENAAGEFRLCEVADKLGLSRPGVSKVAQRLAEEGLILKTDNGRYVISREGKSKLQFYEVCISKIYEMLSEKFDFNKSLLRHEAVLIAGALSKEMLTKIYDN